MKRLEATKRVGRRVERVVSGEGRYLPRVREVRLFGSYARGALEVGDVGGCARRGRTGDARDGVTG